MQQSFEDTIVAIATPPGQGGVGIVRISGQDAHSIAQKIFFSKRSNWQHALMHYGFIQDQLRQNIDDGYLVYFQSPHSFTGEDVIEIQIHGSPYTLNQTISLAVSHGARLAAPGEFSQRAFINEKFDLIQAEAVSELIHAQSQLEAELSRKRLDGKLSNHLAKLREQTIEVLAELDADVDFPEEELDLHRVGQRLQSMQVVFEQSAKILATYKQNETIRDGFRICFVGRPNAGKSSLFNQILQNDRAIVTATAGTTRDTISESIDLQGRKVTLIDTAGIRQQTDDAIEVQGINRAKQEIEKADMVCVIADIQQGLHPELLSDINHVDQAKKVLLYNKIDLVKTCPDPHADFVQTFFINSLDGSGVADFVDFIHACLGGQKSIEFGGGISNDRQRALLEKVCQQVKLSQQVLGRGESPEFVAFEFRRAFEALNGLLGKDDGYEDVYDHIFSTFCIGK